MDRSISFEDEPLLLSFIIARLFGLLCYSRGGYSGRLTMCVTYTRAWVESYQDNLKGYLMLCIRNRGDEADHAQQFRGHASLKKSLLPALRP